MITMDRCDNFEKVGILREGPGNVLVLIVSCWKPRNRGCNFCVCGRWGSSDFTLAKHKPHVPWPLPILLVIWVPTSPAFAHCSGTSIMGDPHYTSGSDGGIGRGHMSTLLSHCIVHRLGHASFPSCLHRCLHPLYHAPLLAFQLQFRWCPHSHCLQGG